MEGFHQAAQALLAVVLLAVSATAQTPVINPGGIVHAADFRHARLSGGAIAQGSIFSLFGSELSAQTFDAESFPLPHQASGVRVEVVAAGIVREAPLLHVDPKQINAVFPSDVPVGPAAVRVVRDGLESSTEPVTVVRSYPGIFVARQVQQEAYSNQRQEAAAQRYIGGQPEPLTLDAPAHPGDDVTLWTTGVFGPRGADDVPVGLAARIAPRVRAFVAGAEAEILYQGPAPCCAGLDQVNIRLPLDAPLGCFVPVQLVGQGLPSNVATIPIAEPGQDCPGHETSLVRVYLERSWDQDETRDRARVFHGRELFDPNEVPPVGSCDVSDNLGVRTQQMIGDPLVRIEAPTTNFVLSQGGGPLLFPPQGAAQLGPGPYRVVSTGGNFPNYDATLTVPDLPLTLGDLSAQTSPRELGLRFTWEGFSGDPSATTGLITAGDRLICHVTLALGEFTIGPAILALLQGSMSWTLTAMISAPLHIETEGRESGQVIYTKSFVQRYDLGSPRLPASPVTLPNGDAILAELATTAAERSKGLMNRRHLDPGRGMLFFFSTPGLHTFWMSQTLIALDILWLDADRRIVSVAAETPPCPSGSPCPVYSPSAPARFVLELASGEAARRNLQLGDQLSW